MTPALTRQDLDLAVCDNPDCHDQHSDLSLSAACHPKAKLDVAYLKASGTLAVTCGRCRKLVTTVLVARELDQ